MNINWKVRVRNPQFWLALIPAVLLLVQVVLACFGIAWDYSVINERLVAVVNALFAVLAILGIVNDMTTSGLGDSQLALTYTEPKKDE